MSANREVVARYMEAYARGDHAAVLATLADDVEWVIPGHAHRHAKAEFEQEMNYPGAAGAPEIAVTRIVEEGDVLVTEGTVRAPIAGGGTFSGAFCDVFEMRGGRIRKLISYVVPLPDPA